MKEDNIALNTALNVAKSANSSLEIAACAERENFGRLKQALEKERIRGKRAAERDTETIMELRTAIEVEREEKMALGATLSRLQHHQLNRYPSASPSLQRKIYQSGSLD